MHWRGSTSLALENYRRGEWFVCRVVPSRVTSSPWGSGRRHGGGTCGVRQEGGNDMTIDRRTLVTGLVSTGALIQANSLSEAATGPEINASVIATLDHFYRQVPGSQSLA